MAIFHVTEAVSLGLHGMGLLALSGERIRAKDLADGIDASEAHMAKVFQKLVRAGLVSSVRGPSGGFKLAFSPNEISLMAIYRAIEGDDRSGCLLGGRKCPFKRCIFGDMPQCFEREFRSRMESTSLADLIEEG